MKTLPKPGKYALFALALLVLLGAISGYIHLIVVRAFRIAPLSS